MGEIKSIKDRNLDAFKEFFDKLYGVDLDYSKTKEFKAYAEGVEEAARKFSDFDVMFTIKHKRGNINIKGNEGYAEPKAILEIIDKGLTLPADIDSFEIVARVAYYKHGKRKFLKKEEDILFSHKVLFTDEAEDIRAVEKLVGQPISKMDKKLKVFSKADFEQFSEIVRFKENRKEEGINV